MLETHFNFLKAAQGRLRLFKLVYDLPSSLLNIKNVEVKFLALRENVM